MLSPLQLDLLDEYREAEGRLYGLSPAEPPYRSLLGLLEAIRSDLKATGMHPELIELHTSTY